MDFSPKTLNIIERTRGCQLVLSDPYGSPSSAVYSFETLQVNATTKAVHNHVSTSTKVIPQAQTTDEKSQQYTLFELNGTPRTTDLVIPKNPTREQLEQLIKLLTNSMLLSFMAHEKTATGTPTP